jgi:hypothetical protein
MGEPPYCPVKRGGEAVRDSFDFQSSQQVLLGYSEGDPFLIDSDTRKILGRIIHEA